MRTVVIGGDHWSLALKKELAEHCRTLGWQVTDIGAHTEEPCDYPLLAAEAGRLVASGQAELGLLICGTGLGMSIAANKMKGVRCACCSEPYSAIMTRAHNNANMLALGARVIGSETAKMIVSAFLETSFEGGRHARRVALIEELENGD